MKVFEDHQFLGYRKFMKIASISKPTKKGTILFSGKVFI